MSTRWRIPNTDKLATMINGGRISAAEFRKATGAAVVAPNSVSKASMSEPLFKLRERLIGLIQRLPPQDPECPHEKELMRFLNGDARTISKFESSQEHLEQTAFFYVLKRLDINIYDLTFSVPNGGFRKTGEAFRLQAEGQKSGIPDVMMTKRVSSYTGLAIEFKRINGCPSDVSENQRTVHRRFEEEGWKVVVAFGYEQGIRAVREYLGVPDSKKWRH